MHQGITRANALIAAAALFGFVVMPVALAGGASGSGGPNATASAKVGKQLRSLKTQVAALQQQVAQLSKQPGPQGPQGATGPSSPPSGTAGGELAGTYPDPTVGTVAGLDVASSTSPTGGINFGADTNLYRMAPNVLASDDFVQLQSHLTVDGVVELGDGLVNPGPSGDIVTIRGLPVFPTATQASGALQIGNIDTNLYRSSADTLHTDDAFDADGALSVDGNATLGNTAADTATLNAGPVNLPNATSAADGLVLGADSNLYRSAANTLHTDDSLEIGGAQLTAPIGEFDTRLLFHTYTDTTLPPNPPTDTASLQVACSGEVPALMVKWPDGEIDVLETDSPESPGNSCPL
jgi:hypothetical protein